MTADDVRDLVRRHIAIAGSQSKWAGEVQISQGYISDFLKGFREPGPHILRVLGLERQMTYRKVKP